MEQEEKVIAIDNKSYPKSYCRLIDGKYYLIGDKKIKNSGHVYLINNRYIRESTNRLIYNHTIMEYELKSNSTIEGIVNFDKTGTPILGYFSLNPIYNVSIVLKDGSKNTCINDSIITLDYREERSTGIYYHITLKTVLELQSLQVVRREYKESLPYDSKGMTSQYLKLYDSNYNPIYTENVEKYSPLLKNYTFGLEFESILGVIPNNKLNYLPLIPLRDGSINGIEYVTVPLQGKKGMQAVIDSVKELKKRTIYDESCALHLHIGNIPRTPEFILAFYKLSCYFQEDMFKMFPLYKKYNFGIKRKNYSKPFDFNKINVCLEPSIDINNKKQVDKNFSLIFDYLSEVASFADYNNNLNNVKVHPRDPQENAKWNISNRYYAVNFIPLIFGNKQTIEFRIHTPTYDIGKIINFLLFNIYCIDYTINNLQNILYDSKFLLKFNNFSTFIESYIYNNTNLKKGLKNVLGSHQISYLRERIQRVYDLNCDGRISGNENSIYCNTVINWNNNLNNNYNEEYEFLDRNIKINDNPFIERERELKVKHNDNYLSLATAVLNAEKTIDPPTPVVSHPLGFFEQIREKPSISNDLSKVIVGKSRRKYFR